MTIDDIFLRFYDIRVVHKRFLKQEKFGVDFMDHSVGSCQVFRAYKYYLVLNIWLVCVLFLELYQQIGYEIFPALSIIFLLNQSFTKRLRAFLWCSWRPLFWVSSTMALQSTVETVLVWLKTVVCIKFERFDLIKVTFFYVYGHCICLFLECPCLVILLQRTER